MVKNHIRDNKVVMFSKTSCGFCHKLKKLFRSKRLDYKVVEVNEIEDGDQIYAALKKLSGRHTVP